LRSILRYIRDGRNYILVLVMLAAVSAWVLDYMVSPVGGSGRPAMVVIPKGVTAAAVGRILAEKGIVRSALGFSLLAQAAGDARELKPGAYLLKPTMGVEEIIEKMVRGEIAAVWVTVPEGFSVRQIAERLGESNLVNPEEFMALAASDAQGFSGILGIPSHSLEGYLFPSTYLVPLKTTAREVAAEMVKTFRAKVAEPYGEDIGRIAAAGGAESRAAALYRVVTAASMIEREAKVPQDRPLISAVIWNRLRRGMRLQIDATVEYALGRHRSRLYDRDLAVDSPYNTYLHGGLPPGPISNPGLPSIRAALFPAKAGYLYYVARADGSHVFSNTLEEHNAAKARIREQAAESGGQEGAVP